MALVSPTTYAASLVQSAMGLIPITWSTAAADWGILTAFTAGLFILASFKARWREA